VSFRRLLLHVVLFLALVGPAALLAPSPAGAVSRVSNALNCTGNPETIKVTNNTTATITVKTIGSLYQPRSNEPLTVNRSLGGGKSVTFKAGPAETAGSSTTLTRQYIFANGVISEGVSVKTNLATYTRKC